MGAVTSAVGAVTGNKDLMKIGAVVGIAGAIGGYAAGEGFFGMGKDTGPTNITGNPTGYEGDIPIGGSDSSGLGNIGGQTLPEVTPDGMGNFDGAAGVGQPNPNPSSLTNTPDASLPDAAMATDNNMAAYTPPSAPDASPNAALGADNNMAGYTPPPAPTPAAPAQTAADAITESAKNPAPSFTNSYQQDPGASVNSIGPGQAGMGEIPPPGMPGPATTFDKLMAGFSKLGSGVGTFAKENPMLATALFNGVSSAADPSQRALREAQTNNLNSNAGYTDQLKKNQSTVGGTIDWNKLFSGSGMIAKGSK